MKVKRILCVILAMAVLLCGSSITSVSADTTDTKSNVTWNYDDKNYTLTISGNGDIGTLSDGYDNYPWKEFRDDIKTVIIGNGITTIREFTFDFLCDLTSVTIPNTVTLIEGSAFRSCHELKSITIPKSVKYLGETVFEHCNNLTNIIVDKDNKYYSSLNGNVYNKNKTKLIEYCYGKKNSSFTVPNTVKTIGKRSLCNNPNLKSIKISNSVTTIGSYALTYCENLENISLGNSVTTIKSVAFGYCPKLKSMYFPKSVKKLEYSIFANCSGLEKITVAKDNPYFASIDDNLYSKNKTTLVKYCGNKSATSFTIPSYVKVLESGSFSGCNNLVYLNIPNTVEDMAIAVNNCPKLKTVKISNKIKHIYSNFYDCENIENVYIPCSVEEITYSFSNSKKIKNVYFEGSKAQWNKINESENLNNATIHYTINDNQVYVKTFLKNATINNKKEIVTIGSKHKVKITPKKGYKLTNVSVNYEYLNFPYGKVPFNSNCCNINFNINDHNLFITAIAKKIQTISAKSFVKKKGCKPFNINAKAKTKLTYTSSNKNVATVNSKGKITVKKVGKATITIKAKENSTYTSATKKITVTVKKK